MHLQQMKLFQPFPKHVLFFIGTVLNRRRTSGPLNLSKEDDQNSKSCNSSSNLTSRNTFIEDPEIKRQDLVTSPIRCDLTSGNISK